jgi:hypothetical protein
VEERTYVIARATRAVGEDLNSNEEENDNAMEVEEELSPTEFKFTGASIEQSACQRRNATSSASSRGRTRRHNIMAH